MGMMSVGRANGRSAGVCRGARTAVERTVAGGLWVGVLEGVGGVCVQTAFLWRLCLSCTCISLPGPFYDHHIISTIHGSLYEGIGPLCYALL